MNIKNKCILTLEDDRKYVVVSSAEYNNEKYYYLVDLLDECNILFVKGISNGLMGIDEEAVLEHIIPLLCNDAIESF